jgi:O-methyltransferase
MENRCVGTYCGRFTFTKHQDSCAILLLNKPFPDRRQLSPKTIHLLNGVHNYLHVGWWLQHHGFEIPARFESRELLYRHLASQVKEPADYLEFGVFRGDSLRCWCGLLQQPETRFAGFDSFEGLPEKWRMAAGTSTFDLKGVMPKFDDSRVQLVKGWFSNTLPPFLKTFTPKPNLVVHMDADIYSSTIFVLNELQPYLQVGTLIIFDEFYDRDHEIKALEEFTDRTHLGLECLGATSALTQVAFRVTASPTTA